MATAGSKKRPPAKVSVSRSDFYVPPLPLAVAPVPKSFGEDVMGWIAACVLVALLLPLGAMLYLDILEAKHEVKVQTEKLERLRREIERERRDKDRKEPDSFGDGPVFDRVRRPFSLPVPKPHKLE
jgi:hypothetical protein